MSPAAAHSAYERALASPPVLASVTPLVINSHRRVKSRQLMETLVRIMSGYYFEITRSTEKQDWKSSKKHRREKLYSTESNKEETRPQIWGTVEEEQL